MPTSRFENVLIVFFRLAMGWTFLFAAIHHFGDSNFVVGFLIHTKTFHSVYAPLTTPAIAPRSFQPQSSRGRLIVAYATL